MVKLLYKASPSRVWLTILFTVISDLFSICYNVFFLAYFMDAVEHGKSIAAVGGALLLFVMINIIFEIGNSYYHQAYLPRNDVKLSLYLKRMICQKIMTVDIECFDDPAYYDNVTFALNDLFERVKSILDHIAQFISHSCCVIVLIGYFAQIDPVIVIISMLSVLTGLIFDPILNRYRYRYSSESLPCRRKFDYVKRISLQAECAQELRTTNIKSVLQKMLYDASLGLQALLKTYYKRITVLDSIQVFFGFGIVSCVTTLLSIRRIVVDQTVTIGMFLPLMGAVAQYTWRASSVIEGFSGLLDDKQYIDKFKAFYQYESKVVSQKELPVDVSFDGLKIEHLYFKYQEKEDYVLKDICMEIRPGQKIALVGYNGAGKSTLISLILRLYDPDRGSIIYNGKDIRDYRIKDYRGKYGVVFQDIHVYAATISQNIAMDTEEYSEEELQKVMDALPLKEKPDRYQDGFRTQLTHELSDAGEVLSVGQNQCLALARIFINPDKQLYILDEPTSALDPIAEAEIFETINRYLADQTVLFISHRFSASKIADRIYFMEESRIAEQGTHEELLRLGGKYAEMFHLQAKYYKR